MNHFKRKLATYTAMLAFISLSSAAVYADVVTDTAGNLQGMTGGNYVNTSATRLDVNNTTGVEGGFAQFDWTNFDVDKGNHVNFGFSERYQTTVNRVLGGKTSEIMGKMTSSCIGGGACSSFNDTSKVIFINPAGVMFGQGSQVDINSFTTSTFDMRGAKNLQGMSESEMSQYNSDMMNQVSANKHKVIINGKSKSRGTVVFDSNYQDAFDSANGGKGIQYQDGATKSIQLNGTTFSHWDANGNELTGTLNTNKSYAFVSDNIEYKDSLLKTGGNYNFRYQDSQGNLVPESYSNVKLITADGVVFNYLNNGYINDHKITSDAPDSNVNYNLGYDPVTRVDKHSDITRTITMDNKAYSDASTPAITSGEIEIEQRAGKAVSGNKPSVVIKDTIIKGTKLVNQENGDIVITGNQDILVDRSRLTTVNTTGTIKIKDKETGEVKTYSASTKDRFGGEIYIKGTKNVTVQDSLLASSGSKGNIENSETSGAIRVISSNGTAKVDGTKILADGHAQVASGDKVEINNSMVQAYNTVDTTTEKDVTISGTNGVKLTNVDSNSKGNIIVKATDSEGKFTGDIEIVGNDQKTIANNDPKQPIMKAKKGIIIEGKNTTVDDVTLAYNESNGLQFYDSSKTGADYTNNVTIKDNTRFAPYNVQDGKEIISYNINVETNGDLTFDNATAKGTGYSIQFDRKDSTGRTGYDVSSDNPLNDDGSVGAITYITENPDVNDAYNFTATSTNGNVKVTNGSNINARNNSTVNAAKDYIQDGESKLTAAKDVTITAGNNATISDASLVQAGHDASITAQKGNVTVTNAQVDATNNASLTASKGKVTVKGVTQTTAGKKVVVTQVQAGNNVNITAAKDVDVTDFAQITAGNNASIQSSKGNITVDYATVEAKKGDADLTANAGTVKVANGNAMIGIGGDGVNNFEVTAEAKGIEAGNNVNINGNKGVTIDKTNVIAGSDRDGFDETDNNLNGNTGIIGDVNITADNGSVSIMDSIVRSDDKDVNITASNDITTTNSSVTALNDIKATAGNNVKADSSTFRAENDATIKANAGNIQIDKTNILAKDNNARLDAQNGTISLNANSRVEAGNDATVIAGGNIKVYNSNVIAGSDRDGFDTTDNTENGNTGIKGDANIISNNGSVDIHSNSKVLSQDHDVNITAFNAIKFGNAVPSPETPSQPGDNIDSTVDITALHNVNITSTNDNIEGEKTTMPTITYGNELTFDADKSNIFTSQDSLKSVSVNYKAGVSNQIYTQGDAQFVNSTFEAPNNFVESGKDVILNNLEIKKATDDAKDTVTEIFANGNVTTYNVTGETLGAKTVKDAQGNEYHTYPQSVDTNRVAKGDKTMPQYVKGLDSTTLDINQTKLKVTTDTVKDPSNPDNGSITLVLKNADNTNAGIELKANNVDALDKDPTDGYFKTGYYKSGDHLWDGEGKEGDDLKDAIAPKEGPEIVLDAEDDKIAIKELDSDKLTLDPTDKMFADDTDGTPVITIKDQGGFNKDPEIEYKDPDGFTYDKDYESHEKSRTPGVLTMDENWSDWVLIDEYMDEEGATHKIYESTQDGTVSETIVTQIDHKHTITFDNEGNPSEFTLVYDKQKTTTEPGYKITAEQVRQDDSVLDTVTKADGTKAVKDEFFKYDDIKSECPPPEDPDRGDNNITPTTSDVSLVTLPREQVETSKTSTVADNTADQTSNIMSAAAKVDLGQEIDADYDDDDDDDSNQ